MNQKLSHQTQLELCRVILQVICGDKRIKKNLSYLHQLPRNSQNQLMSGLITDDRMITWKHIQKFLSERNLNCTREDCINILLQLGGSVEYITSNQFDNYFSYTNQIIEDTDIYDQEVLTTLANFLFEIVVVEKKNDKVKEILTKRWDYSLKLCFSCITQDTDINLQKLKVFMTRRNILVTEDDLYQLIKEHGKDQLINYSQFSKILSSQKEKVKAGVELWSMSVKQKDLQKIKEYSSPTSSSRKEFVYPLARNRVKTITYDSSPRKQSPKENSKHSIEPSKKFTALKELKNRQTVPRLDSTKATPQKFISQTPVTANKKEFQFQIKENGSQGQFNHSKRQSQVDTSKYVPKTQINSAFIDFVREVSKLHESCAVKMLKLSEQTVEEVNLLDIKLWFSFWQHHNIDTQGIDKECFMNFCYQFKAHSNKGPANDLDYLSEIFKCISDYHKTIREAKVRLFMNKKCSFISLFQELDTNESNLLSVTDLIRNIVDIAEIEIRSFWSIFQSQTVDFNQFLQILTPTS